MNPKRLTQLLLFYLLPKFSRSTAAFKTPTIGRVTVDNSFVFYRYCSCRSQKLSFFRTDSKARFSFVHMKIQKANAGPLTNFEVLDLLRSRGAARDHTRAMSLITPSEFKVYDYLVESAACNQTRESIKNFLEKSKEYQLAKAEVINIINIRPTSAVELAPIIEELDEHKLEEDLDKMVDIVVQVFPPHPNEQNVDEEAPEDGSPEMPVDDAENEPKAS